jgi:hypothetical protein
MGPSGVTVADIFVAFGADGAQVLDGFIAPVPGGEDGLAGLVVRREYVLALERGGDGDAGQGEGDRGEVDMFTQGM